MLKKLLPHEWFHTYRARPADDGQWKVWAHNADVPHIVASFPSEEQARSHAVDLNALWMEEYDASVRAFVDAPRPPSGMWGAFFRFLRLGS